MAVKKVVNVSRYEVGVKRFDEGAERCEGEAMRIGIMLDQNCKDGGG